MRNISFYKTANKLSYRDKDMEIFNRYKQGDPNAKWELVKHLDPIIQSNVRKYSNVLPRSVVEAQLKQYTLKAIDSFKPDTGNQLKTHVMGQMRKINRSNYQNQSAIRLPENYYINYKPYQDTVKNLTESFGREPSDSEVAGKLGWRPLDAQRARERYTKEFFEGQATYDVGMVDRDDSSSALRFAYNSMSPLEKRVLELKSGYGGIKAIPAGKIHQVLKITPSRMNRLQQSVVGKIQEAQEALESLDLE